VQLKARVRDELETNVPPPIILSKWIAHTLEDANHRLRVVSHELGKRLMLGEHHFETTSELAARVFHIHMKRACFKLRATRISGLILHLLNKHAASGYGNIPGYSLYFAHWRLNNKRTVYVDEPELRAWFSVQLSDYAALPSVRPLTITFSSLVWIKKLPVSVRAKN
jgi:hypothetical protein